MTISSIRSPSVVSSSEAAAIVSGDDSLRKNRAAARHLLFRQAQVVSPLGGDLRLGGEVVDDQRDGRERRAQFVCGRGGDAVELAQVLLAGEGELGGGQRAGELPRLLGDPAAVDGDKGAADGDAYPHSHDV